VTLYDENINGLCELQFSVVEVPVVMENIILQFLFVRAMCRIILKLFLVKWFVRT
jgi:hypothetical protein